MTVTRKTEGWEGMLIDIKTKTHLQNTYDAYFSVVKIFI